MDYLLYYLILLDIICLIFCLIFWDFLMIFRDLFCTDDEVTDLPQSRVWNCASKFRSPPEAHPPPPSRLVARPADLLCIINLNHHLLLDRAHIHCDPFGSWWIRSVDVLYPAFAQVSTIILSKHFICNGCPIICPVWLWDRHAFLYPKFGWTIFPPASSGCMNKKEAVPVLERTDS